MPKTKLLLPKFLTINEANTAIGTVASAVKNRVPLQRPDFHIVLLVPALETHNLEWPNHPIHPYLLAEASFGDKEKWPYDFAEIARCKAHQLWQERNDGGTDIKPHLLFPTEAPFWGGVKRSGIVVACSGVQPHFDRMIAGMVADMCIGLAYEAWMESSDMADDELCFLT